MLGRARCTHMLQRRQKTQRAEQSILTLYRKHAAVSARAHTDTKVAGRAHGAHALMRQNRPECMNGAACFGTLAPSGDKSFSCNPPTQQHPPPPIHGLAQRAERRGSPPLQPAHSEAALSHLRERRGTAQSSPLTIPPLPSLWGSGDPTFLILPPPF